MRTTPPKPEVRPPPVITTTLVQLYATPDVTVYQDNRALGHTPLSVPMAPGSYVLTLVDETRHIHTSKKIEVRASAEPVTFRIPLQVVSVKLMAGEGDRVSVDGEDLGKAPFLKDLYEGEHTARVTHDGVDYQRPFVVPQSQRFQIDLAPSNAEEDLPQ